MIKNFLLDLFQHKNKLSTTDDWLDEDPLNILGNIDPIKKTGVLFGFDPPAGHYFKVEYSGGTSPAWWVWIKENKTHKSRGYELELLEYNNNDDRECIRKAVSGLLRKHKANSLRQSAVAKFQGCYPPKHTE